MNYRHAFHAGNHCDVLKHTALAYVLARLTAKERPFFVLDTHGGRGRYDFLSAEAARSPEYESGIGRLFARANLPEALSAYVAAVADENPGGDLRWYPGSPVLTQAAMREGDRAIFCELHDGEADALESALGLDRRCAVRREDGYQVLKAALPPAERRGIVLIDPPFEQKNEFAALAQALRDFQKRWASGTAIAWYPIKGRAAVEAFRAETQALGAAKFLHAELTIASDEEGRLTGSGLFVINPSFGLADALARALGFAAPLLAAAPGGGFAVSSAEAGETVFDAAAAL